MVNIAGASGESKTSESIRRKYLKHEASVKAIGILFYLGAFLLLGKFIGRLIFGEKVPLTFGIPEMALLLIMGIFHVCIGRGIRKLDKAYRIPIIINSASGLFLLFPISILLHGYILFIVLNKKGRMVFSDDYRKVIETTPHIKYKSHAILIGVVAFFMIWVVIIGFAVIYSLLVKDNSVRQNPSIAHLVDYNAVLLRSSPLHDSESIQSFVACWKFDNPKGDRVVDSSTNGLHGNLMNGASIINDSERGNVLKLDGLDDYVEFGNDSRFDITDKITVVAWIKVGRFDRSWNAIVTKGDSAWRLSQEYDEDSLAFHCTGIKSSSKKSWGSGWRQLGVEGHVNVNDGKWHHVAGVYDGSKISLYVDGVLDNSEDATGKIAVNDYPVLIGENSEERGRYWNGLIDDVRIYSYALSESEIKDLYAGKDPK